MRYTGQALGIAVGAAVVESRIPVHMQDLAGTMSRSLVERDAFILAIHDSFYVAVAICVIGVMTSMVRSRKQTATEGEADC